MKKMFLFIAILLLSFIIFSRDTHALGERLFIDCDNNVPLNVAAKCHVYAVSEKYLLRIDARIRPDDGLTISSHKLLLDWQGGIVDNLMSVHTLNGKSKEYDILDFEVISNKLGEVNFKIDQIFYYDENYKRSSGNDFFQTITFVEPVDVPNTNQRQTESLEESSFTQVTETTTVNKTDDVVEQNNEESKETIKGVETKEEVVENPSTGSILPIFVLIVLSFIFIYVLLKSKAIKIFKL